MSAVRCLCPRWAPLFRARTDSLGQRPWAFCGLPVPRGRHRIQLSDAKPERPAAEVGFNSPEESATVDGPLSAPASSLLGQSCVAADVRGRMLVMQAIERSRLGWCCSVLQASTQSRIRCLSMLEGVVFRSFKFVQVVLGFASRSCRRKNKKIIEC